MASTKKGKKFVLRGSVSSGLGEGRYFMRKPKYRKQFVSRLKINPYLGTLNIKLSKASSASLSSIKRRKAILVSGFKEGSRSFGAVLCYDAMLRGERCALIVPKLSKHTAVAELISSEKLRDKLKLKDGARVQFEVFA